MSQHSDQCSTLRRMLVTYPSCAVAVIETFEETVSNAEWPALDVVDMLSSAIGISDEIDELLNSKIENHRASLRSWIKQHL